jgi:hypothetical protein
MTRLTPAARAAALLSGFVLAVPAPATGGRTIAARAVKEGAVDTRTP